MAEEKDIKEEAQPKKPFLKFIILGVIALVLGAGGSAGWDFFIKGKKEEIKKEEIKKEEIKKEAHKPYSKKKKEKPGIAYPLDSFIVNLLDKSGAGKRYLKIKVVLEVGDEEGQRTVDSHIPQLKDTILLLLSSQSFSDINTMEGKIELKQILLSKINQVLGEGIVHRLYFTEFVVQ